MKRALAWIRKSKGSDDDVGLELQREEVHALAEELGDEVDTLDLGVQTGFSTLTRDPDASTTWIDQHLDVQDTVEELRSGAYDVLVAFDDRRVARDEYFSVIEHAAVQGGCDVAFVSDDVETDDLAFDIQRRVERKTKDEEIKKSKAAVKEKQENGHFHGTVPFGLAFTADKMHLEKHPVEWDQLLDAIERRENGETLASIADDIGTSAPTVSRMTNRGVEWYEEKLREYGREEPVPHASNQG
ncbi:Resolvase domain protein [Halorhabdus tiamatea SARL4B]|uniref:Resolvase domain protein n=1 Tax=Halorhabdus tiamatea SARL4B TaxID=1033806 RepID=F7PI30_9EURY|nr:resolvase [Halorhabdus tiamatea]ERJ06625.1 Resolvase domain protein [Halorhabdus tiamatea SARL4B]CCQ32221.1 resolvase domain protein [Halorhabdus tiamatea SARL4B]